MRIVIPSKGRSQTIRTHKFLDSCCIDYKIVLHDEKERSEYLKNKTIDGNKIIVSGASYNVCDQRNWILNNLICENEWFISLDDNIDGFFSAQDEFYNKEELATEDDIKKNNSKFHQILKKEINAIEFLSKCNEMKELAEKTRTSLIGFATTDNPLFRRKKIKHFGYVIAKAIIKKKINGLLYPEGWKFHDDYHDTAEHLLRFGKVIINQFIRPKSQHYEAGGIGKYETRIANKIIYNELLMKKYPGLFRYFKKKDCPDKAEISLRLTSHTQIEKWRAWMKYNMAKK